MKYTDAAKIVFTDYTEEVNGLLAENIKMQGKSRVT